MQTVFAKKNDRTVGVSVMILACLFFTGSDTLTKFLSHTDIQAIQIVFVRYLFHFLGSLFAYTSHFRLSSLASISPGRQILRACCLLMAMMANVVTLQYLSVTVTTVISFAEPILVTVLAVFFLGEHLTKATIAAVLFGFLGVLIVFRPWGGEFHPAMIVSIAMILSGSFYYILTRMLSRFDSIAVMQMWTSTCGLIILLPFVLAYWVWPATVKEWVQLCFVGICGALAQTLVTTAHGYASASVLAPVVYTQLIFATVSGILFFNIWPTWPTVAGGAFIAISGACILHQTKAHTATC